MTICFSCARAPAQGGETPLADGRRVLARLDPAIGRRLAARGVRYVRNYVAGIDVSWQQFFGTQARAQVEASCRAAGMSWEWRGAEGLRTQRVCRAVARHPRTGERVFFNQIQLHHVSCLPAEVGAALGALFGSEELPRNVYYGDGGEIEAGVVAELRGVYAEVAVSFAWAEGDVLVVEQHADGARAQPLCGSPRDPRRHGRHDGRGRSSLARRAGCIAPHPCRPSPNTPGSLRDEPQMRRDLELAADHSGDFRYLLGVLTTFGQAVGARADAHASDREGLCRTNSKDFGSHRNRNGSGSSRSGAGCSRHAAASAWRARWPARRCGSRPRRWWHATRSCARASWGGLG